MKSDSQEKERLSELFPKNHETSVLCVCVSIICYNLHNNGRVSGGGVTNFDYPDEQNIQEVENLYQKAEMCVCGSNYT